MTAPVEPRPAATVVLVRQVERELEVLLLLRNTQLAFNAGHWVFPGGKIDAADFADRENPLEYPAALRAAVRETWEEAGIAIDAGDLIHTAHWTTPAHLPLRYSTWFFVCPLERSVEVKVDQDEITDFRWLSPGLALAQAAAGKLSVPRPTLTTLQDLSAYSNLSNLRAGIARGGIRVFPDDSPYYRPREMGYPG